MPWKGYEDATLLNVEESQPLNVETKQTQDLMVPERLMDLNTLLKQKSIQHTDIF